MSSSREIHVRMCELAVGQGQDVLRATLGSCVGIGLMWRERGLYGLAHCLLPEAPGAACSIGAKYVTQAIPSLLTLMHAKDADPASIEAVLVGGANMMHSLQPARHSPIGEQNAITAERLLAKLGLKVVHADVGGECGRQLSIHCSEHRYAVKQISRSC